MKKKIIVTLLTAVSVASVLAGCGNSGNKSDVFYANTATESGSGYSGGGYYYDEFLTADADIYEDYNSFGTSGVDVSDSAASSNSKTDDSRKLIRTVRMQVETLEYDNLLNAITTQVQVCGGYIENSYTDNGSKYGQRYYETKNGSMVIRIPAEKLDSFLESFSPLCNILSKTEGVEDVTLTYVDLESHKKALQTEETRLLELLEVADNLDDMLTIESRLTDIRYQLESMESQLRTYDNKINYSTVYIDINEVREITPEPEPEPETAWERISRGFTDSMSSIGHGLSEFGIWFVVKLPYLILWAAIIVAHVFIIRGIIRFNIRKNKKRREALEAGLNSKRVEQNVKEKAEEVGKETTQTEASVINENQTEASVIDENQTEASVIDENNTENNSVQN